MQERIIRELDMNKYFFNFFKELTKQTIKGETNGYERNERDYFIAS